MVTIKAAALVTLAFHNPFNTLDSTKTQNAQSFRFSFAQNSILPVDNQDSKSLSNTNLNDPLPSNSQDPTIPGNSFSQQQFSYESWDVLRQYPRTAPLAEPRTSQEKPSEPPLNTKDSKNAQSKNQAE